MKVTATCPGCGSANLRIVSGADRGWLVYENHTECLECKKGWTETQMLMHMREQPGVPRNGRAFWRLDIKAKGKSEAAKKVFG